MATFAYKSRCLSTQREAPQLSLSFLAQQLATPPRRLDFLERRYIYKIEKLFEYICIYTLPVRFSATSHIPYTLHSIRNLKRKNMEPFHGCRRKTSHHEAINLSSLGQQLLHQTIF